MRPRTLFIACFAVASITFGLAACSSDDDGGATADTPSDPVLAEGQTLYASNCSSCHGASGEGGIGIKLAGNVETRYPNIADQEAVILNGRGTMPAFKEKLTPEQVTAIARYEREVL